VSQMRSDGSMLQINHGCGTLSLVIKAYVCFPVSRHTSLRDAWQTPRVYSMGLDS
jgi:hypothetical protein